MDTILNNHDYYDQIFEKVHLEANTTLSATFTDCEFVKCTLTSVTLNNCRFSGCTFLECDLSLAQIPGCSFPATRFEKSKLIGINWTLADWSLPGFQKLIGFYDCVLNHSTLIGLELENLQIINCIVHEVDFRETNCSKADFKGTDFAKSIFGNTNLTKADLSQARNYAIDPGNNILKKAKFALPEAMSLLYNMDIILKE